jgi:glycosyltransferase involved in cell wall biosynthesis
MRILLLCDRYPYPLENGQNLRIFHYVRQLSSRHAFDLTCYGEGEVPEAIRPLFRRIEAFPRPAARHAAGWARVRGAFAVDSMIPASPAVAARLKAVLAGGDYDLVWVSGWDMAVNLPWPLGVPLLMDAVDDGVLEHWRELRAARSLAQFARMAKRLAMNYRFERRYFRPADRCLFVSEVDARFFAKVCPGTPVSVVHNGVDEEFFRPVSGERDPANIVFEGNIGFRPNTDGILHFCREVFPLIRANLPQVRLTIAGKSPPPEIRALASSHIEVTGQVADVRPYLERAALFVCPLRKGAGIKNKVLQAWSMAKAVVATPPSVGGLRVRDGENIVVRDEPESFARAVIDLLRDPAAREAIGANARRTVLAHYTWGQKAGELEAVMHEVAAGAYHA